MINKILYVSKKVLGLIEERRILEFGGSLAFFWFLAIFPGATFFLSFIAYFKVSRELFFEQLVLLIPGDISEIFFESIARSISTPNEGLISGGAFLFLWSGSQGFSILITLTVQAYGKYETRNFFKRRGLAVLFMMLFSVCILILVSINIWWQVFSENFYMHFGESPVGTVFLLLGGYVILLIIMFLFISIFFKYAPEEHVKWRYVIPGSIFSIFFWQLTSYLFSLYISQINDFSVYGSLGGITISMVWFYLTAILLLLGVEINIAWAEYKLKHTRIKKIEK